MYRNRIPGEAASISLPQPPTPMMAVHAFVLCPVVLPAANWPQMMAQQWLYQRAFEEAQAVARPSLPERDLLAVWN
jgi:hypothetical protein